MAYRYTPLPRLEGSGFYNPNMPGPDWAQGFSGLLGTLEARRQQKRQEEAEEREREQKERAFGLEERRVGAYEEQVRLAGKQRPSAQERLQTMLLQEAQKIWPDDPEKAFLAATKQLETKTGTGKTTGVSGWIGGVQSRITSEMSQLRRRADDILEAIADEEEAMAPTGLVGVSEDPKARATYKKIQKMQAEVVKIEQAIQNLKQGWDGLAQMEGAYYQNNQVATPDIMKGITAISSNLERIKVGDFSFMQPGGGTQPTQATQPTSLHPFIQKYLEKYPEAAKDPNFLRSLQLLNMEQPRK